MPRIIWQNSKAKKPKAPGSAKAIDEASKRAKLIEQVEKEEAKARREALERLLAQQMAGLNFPEWVAQHQFCERKWRFDFAWPEMRVAVEVHGGTKNGGAHVRPQGFENDRIKMNTAQALGWQVFEFTEVLVREGKAVKFMAEIFKRAGRGKAA